MSVALSTKPLSLTAIMSEPAWYTAIIRVVVTRTSIPFAAKIAVSTFLTFRKGHLCICQMKYAFARMCGSMHSKVNCSRNAK